jgi:peptide/nickel transport system ATP-binding protein
MTETILSVRNLSVAFPTQDGVVHAVDGVSYDVQRGKTLAIVGESGSGKSVSSLAVMGLLGATNAQVSGEVHFAGHELVSADPELVRALRGRRIAMIFQDPLSSLHPFYTVGAQLIEAVQVHHEVSEAVARDRARAMLVRVGISEPDARLDSFPHQLSGGMRQRVMIAMALINEPELLIADEPTTALDVTVQAQILELLQDLQREFGTAIVLITHDLGVVAEVADDVLVMYGGSAVEHAPVREVFYRPQMPYTWGLLATIPRIDEKLAVLDPIPGTPPSLINLPAGCVFAPRCESSHLVADGKCRTQRPELHEVGPDHLSRCHLAPDQREQARRDTRAGGRS